MLELTRLTKSQLHILSLGARASVAANSNKWVCHVMNYSWDVEHAMFGFTIRKNALEQVVYQHKSQEANYGYRSITKPGQNKLDNYFCCWCSASQK